MNKGIEAKNRVEIFKNSEKAGIMNHIFAMWDFPSETFAEVESSSLPSF